MLARRLVLAGWQGRVLGCGGCLPLPADLHPRVLSRSRAGRQSCRASLMLPPHVSRCSSSCQTEELKRLYAERGEKLRKTEALNTQLRQQQQQAPAAAAAAEQGCVPQQQQAQDRRISAEQPSTSQRTKDAGARSSGHKRRQSGSSLRIGAGIETDGGAVASPDGAGADAAGTAAAAPAPLLDPAVLAAAAGLQRAALLDQLMAACSASMAVLTGAAHGSSPVSPSSDDAAVGASTALLLRSRLAAAAAAPDSESLQFTAAFVRRLQHVACGLLPPPALLDSIAGLAASSLAQLHAAPGTHWPPQRVRLIAAGLHVAQHLLALDAGCCEAAAAHAPSSSGSSTAVGAAARPGLSSRVTISSSGLLAPSAAAPAASWLTLGSSNTSSSGDGSAGMPATAAVLQQHAPAFAAFGSGGGPLLPVLLSAALSLGTQHEAVAAGALGSLLELARALQGQGARAALEPVFTSGGTAARVRCPGQCWKLLPPACFDPRCLCVRPSRSAGAMELLMQPPALRMQALQLLQLLLEDATLAQLFECSLSQAAAARGEPGPPTATAGTGGTGISGGTGEGGGASHTPGRAAVPGGGDDGVQAMQADESEAGGPWIGAAVIAERLLESFVLTDGLAIAPEAPSSGGSEGGSSASSPAAAAGAAAAAAEPGGSSTAMARAAMQLVAALREQRQRGILAALLLDDACGAPGSMLAQHLVQLAGTALALSGDEAALQLLCPLQWPARPGSSGGGGGTLLHQQAAWQQRLRVAQEALTLLRGLLVDSECSECSGVLAVAGA